MKIIFQNKGSSGQAPRHWLSSLRSHRRAASCAVSTHISSSARKCISKAFPFHSLYVANKIPTVILLISLVISLGIIYFSQTNFVFAYSQGYYQGYYESSYYNQSSYYAEGGYYSEASYYSQGSYSPPQAGNTFSFEFETNGYCVRVDVTKSATHPKTKINSRGYNTSCASIGLNNRTLERAVELTY